MSRNNAEIGERGSSWRVVLWGGAALLFLLPLGAMQLSNEVNWGTADFVIFGAMLVAACSAYEIAARLTRNTAYRAVAGVAIAAAFFLVWLDLAVGIVGSY